MLISHQIEYGPSCAVPERLKARDAYPPSRAGDFVRLGPAQQTTRRTRPRASRPPAALPRALLQPDRRAGPPAHHPRQRRRPSHGGGASDIVMAAPGRAVSTVTTATPAPTTTAGAPGPPAPCGPPRARSGSTCAQERCAPVRPRRPQRAPNARPRDASSPLARIGRG